jgi:hypothetical protein
LLFDLFNRRRADWLRLNRISGWLSLGGLRIITRTGSRDQSQAASKTCQHSQAEKRRSGSNSRYG